MDQLRIGIAGLGHRGRWWVELLQRIPGYRITAIYDFITPLHEQALALIPYRDQVEVFSDYNEFLAYQGMDAVGLCVRCREQGAMAAAALAAGKHCNSEVPAAHSIDDCWKIVLAAEKSGKVYQLGEQVRFGGFVEAWRNLVSTGQLGHVTYCEGQYIGWYGTRYFFQDLKTGQLCPLEELANHPEAKATWFIGMEPISYVIHDLSPLMKVLDDRPVRVVGMGTRNPSYTDDRVTQADIQVALVQMAKDTVVRLAVGFTQPGPHDDHHWWQCIGTKGRVAWRRDPKQKPTLWLANGQMHTPAEVDWRYERTDAPPEAASSGHADMDYYVHAQFRDAVMHGRKVELDCYGAAETAAVGALAAESIQQGSKPMEVPDFRPNARRAKGQAPPPVA